MQYTGIIIHNSACPSINGKGYDFFISKDGSIMPASEQTEPSFIHICLEGDYSLSHQSLNLAQKEQIFLLTKLIYQLCSSFGLTAEDVYPHRRTCPGAYFPWSELVISTQDGYH